MPLVAKSHVPADGHAAPANRGVHRAAACRCTPRPPSLRCRWALEHEQWHGRVESVPLLFEAASRDLGEAEVTTPVVRRVVDTLLPGGCQGALSWRSVEGPGGPVTAACWGPGRAVNHAACTCCWAGGPAGSPAATPAWGPRPLRLSGPRRLAGGMGHAFLAAAAGAARCADCQRRARSQVMARQTDGSSSGGGGQQQHSALLPPAGVPRNRRRPGAGGGGERVLYQGWTACRRPQVSHGGRARSPEAGSGGLRGGGRG